MIFITVGTQVKQFERILKIVDNAIIKGVVKEEVVAQIGYTKFKSDNIKLYNFVSGKELNKYISEADLVITHAGIGSLTTALNNKKKIFAMPRLAIYNEHVNDHQEQICDKFAKLGYLKRIDDYDDFVREYKNLSKFKPKYPNFDNKKMLGIIEDYIK